tara:strand:- start:403 stop:717 length:315 start_codon:yes stop_codon:yes gene_type:complete
MSLNLELVELSVDIALAKTLLNKESDMNKTKLKDVQKSVEEMLVSKQKNGTIKSEIDEAVFLCGAMTVIHQVFSSTPDSMDSVPPMWVFSGMSGRSVNDYNYDK